MRYPQNEGDYLGPLTYPVQSESDVELLQLLDPKTSGEIPRQFEFKKLQKKAGLPITFFPGRLFAWHLTYAASNGSSAG